MLNDFGYTYFLVFTLLISNTVYASTFEDFKAIMASGWQKTKETLHLERKQQPFCTSFPEVYEPSVYDAASSADQYTPLIVKYCPIAYLHKEERALPMSALHYFGHENTEIVHQPDHRKSKPGKKETLIPKGQVTPQALFTLSQERKFTGDTFAEIDPCVTAGADPKNNTDSDGNLTTPAYVKVKEIDGKLYITYIFFYGFNFPYQLKMPLFRIPLPPGQILNAHESDVEHITQEFIKEKGVWTLSRIFYAAHGSEEGLWLNTKDASKNPLHTKVTFESTHPVVYIAKGGHGCYPEQGTYVRIFGFANDRTDKNSIRWTPSWVRLYEPEEQAFNPELHGWPFLPGDFGKRGVNALGHNNWFKNPTSELKYGLPKNRHFCPTGLLHSTCVKAKTLTAIPPTK